jgi:hypothetical protein
MPTLAVDMLKPGENAARPSKLGHGTQYAGKK